MLISLTSIYKTSVIESLKELKVSFAREAPLSAQFSGSDLPRHAVVSSGGFRDRPNRSLSSKVGKKKRRPVRGGGPTMLDGMFTCRGGEELSRGTLDVRCELVLNEESLMPQLDWARGGYAYYCSSFLLASSSQKVWQLVRADHASLG